jgi:ATP synthase protein I
VKFLPSTSAKPDDNVGRGIELVVGIVVFLGLGWLLDRWLDTKPIFMIVFFVFAVVGNFVKLWLGYDKKMRAHEAELKAKRETATRTVTVAAAKAVTPRKPASTRRAVRP